uniref:Peptidase S1 domain-containing protein n=1 Tax=Globodera pallida TaxID=36090 RepID=A0A183CNV9_GLOPA
MLYELFTLSVNFSLLLFHVTFSQKCGEFKTDEGNEFKVSNGEPVQSHSKWPWMAALFSSQSGICFGTNNFCCSASIIGRRYVLTAAHCFPPYPGEERQNLHKNVHLRLGSFNYSSEDAIEPKLEKVTVHPDFSDETMLNDLAIIKLNEPLEFTANVRPICLYNSFGEEATNAKPTKAYIVGWGNLHEAEYDENGIVMGREPDENPEILREGHTEVRNPEECEKLIDKLDICLEGRLCSEIGHQNAEMGDSGGPLLSLSQNGTRWTQLGVTNIAALKKEDRVAILYTRVSDYCGWIEQNTRGEVICL